MYRNKTLLLLLALFSLHSCFISRQQKARPEIPVINPVKTTLDTTTILQIREAGDTIPITKKKSESDSLALRVSEAGHAYKNPVTTKTELTGKVDSLYADLADSVLTDIRLIDTITIIGTGDIMPGTNYPDDRYLPPGNDCSRLFSPVKDILQTADVTFGNLEGVFCSEGGTPKKCKNPDVCYVFRMPDEYLDCVLEAGYNLLSVANNHVNDFGLEGRIKTVELLDSKGVAFAGFISRPSTIFEVGGVRYGFAAFAPHIGTLRLKDYEQAAEIVAGLDSVADIVIVSFHGGAEGKDFQHVPCTDEIYLGYNRGNVCKFAHTVVDAGADVVFGHGPHVTRAMELYKDRLICYSLGNFCTYARFNLSGPNGIAPLVKVQLNYEGSFIGGQVIPVYQPGEGGPRLDARKQVILKLRELNKADFPDNKLEIDTFGRMKIRE